MHILMVAPQPFFRPRGTPFSVLHRIRALAMLGHTVELVTYPFGDSPEVPGLTIHRTARPAIVRDVKIGPSAAKLVLDVPLFRYAARLARSRKFDLLHTHEEAGWLGAWLRQRTGIPHLYDMHSSLPQQLANFGRFDWGPVRWVFERLERYTLDHSDGVIAICDELHDQVVALRYPGPLALIENVLDFPPVPIPDGDAQRLRHELALGDGPVLVYTGTLETYQGLDLLLAATPAVVERVPGVRIVLVGGTAAQIAGLQAHATALGVEAAIRFVPAVPPTEVMRYLQLADALVTTRARGTNTPLKLYQYLRAGRPIVATDIRSHTQVLDASSAELVAPNAAAIAEGIVRVLTDHPRAATLATGAGVLAREKYSEEVYLARLERLLARIPLRTVAGRG
jgi:glycosyltransferase involved in cell wall biosynthesis